MTGPIQEALPITVLLPEASSQPVMIYESSAALRIAIVERDAVQMLGAEWDQPGNYILLDLPAEDGSWGAYVGKAPGGIRTRLLSHLRTKDYWRRAVLVERDTTHGFNSAQVGWLEGRLYDLLDAAEDARLHNGNRPSDETLPSFERAVLEAIVVPVSRVLRLIGYDPATPDDTGSVSTTTRTRRTSRFYGITVKQIVEAGFLHPDAVLVSTNAEWPATARLLGDGRIDLGGNVYDTPSAATLAVTGHAENGWTFWAVEDGAGKTRLATHRARFLDAKHEGTVPSDSPTA